MSQKSGKNDRILTPDDMIKLYTKLIDKYPILSIEDPFDQDDFKAY